MNDWDDYPEEALEKEKIGGMEFNVEKIIAMNPEIVFAHESALGVGFRRIPATPRCGHSGIRREKCD